MKHTPLSRVLGSHASLLGMASYLVLSGPSAAFAATDSKTVTLQVQVTSTITLTNNTSASASMTGSTVPAISAGGAAATGDATFTVNSNNYSGYNLAIVGTRCGTPANGILCSGTTTLADAGTMWDAEANTNAGNASTTLSNGLMFRVLVGSAGHSSTWWGATDVGGTAKWGAVPTASEKVVNKATPGGADVINVRFSVQAPTGQNSGTYTNTTPITFTATTNP